jgi:hypothetical protein
LIASVNNFLSLDPDNPCGRKLLDSPAAVIQYPAESLDPGVVEIEFDGVPNP